MIKMAVDFDSRKSWISSELEKLSMGTYRIGIKILLSKNIFQKKLDQWKKQDQAIERVKEFWNAKPKNWRLISEKLLRN